MGKKAWVLLFWVMAVSAAFGNEQPNSLEARGCVHSIRNLSPVEKRDLGDRLIEELIQKGVSLQTINRKLIYRKAYNIGPSEKDGKIHLTFFQREALFSYLRGRAWSLITHSYEFVFENVHRVFKRETDREQELIRKGQALLELQTKEEADIAALKEKIERQQALVAQMDRLGTIEQTSRMLSELLLVSRLSASRKISHVRQGNGQGLDVEWELAVNLVINDLKGRRLTTTARPDVANDEDMKAAIEFYKFLREKGIPGSSIANVSSVPFDTLFKIEKNEPVKLTGFEAEQLLGVRTDYYKMFSMGAEEIAIHRMNRGLSPLNSHIAATIVPKPAPESD